jgi:hypothetical protein
MSINYDVTSENDGDGSDGCDGSRASASDINYNDPIAVTASNQSEINSNFIEGQGVTRSHHSRHNWGDLNNPIDTQRLLLLQITS